LGLLRIILAIIIAAIGAIFGHKTAMESYPPNRPVDGCWVVVDMLGELSPNYFRSTPGIVVRYARIEMVGHMG
jgi:hypothetical protein